MNCCLGFVELSPKNSTQNKMKKTHLKSVQINLTNRCQWHCKFCDKPSWPQIDMELPIFSKLLETLPTDVTVVLSGGEPLLHPKINDILGALEPYHVGILTSGMHRNSLDFSQIDAGVDWIRITVLANSDTVYAKMVKPRNVIAKQQQFIKRIASAEITGECTVCRENKDDLPTEEFWHIPIKYYQVHSKLSHHEFGGLVGDRDESFIIPWYHCVVDPSGEIYTDCINYRDVQNFEEFKDVKRPFMLGNLTDDSFDSIWHSAQAETARIAARITLPRIRHMTSRYAAKNYMLWCLEKRRLFL